MKLTLFEGDGIGPEVTSAALEVIEAAGASIEWERFALGQKSLDLCGETISQQALESVKRNGAALKGPVTTPVGKGFRSVNVALRKELGLYANVRPVKKFPSLPGKFETVDMVIVRENTQGLYSGVEHMQGDEKAVSERIITRQASLDILRYGFSLARREGRKKVSVFHKANILKLTDGLFLECAREVAKEFEDICYEEVIIDAACMKMVMAPEQFDVIVTTNLFGDIVSDLASGLVGGLGLTVGANIGRDAAVFEAVHGSAPDIAGKNIANPTAVILAGAKLLAYVGCSAQAAAIERAVQDAFAAGECTADIGGNLSTTQFTQALLRRL